MSAASDGFTPDIATLAVDYHRSPIKYRSWVLPPAELPDDSGKLLHVVCGDGELLAKLSRQAEVTPSQLKTAAEFFIQQAFFARDADYYRVLGLRPTDGIERIKEHHRLLMKLFHPDRADTEGEWTDSLATRVNQAYTVLRKPESRREYDASLRAPHAAKVTAGQQGVVKSRWARMPRPGLVAKIDKLPPGVRRRFPEFVLGGIGMIAALTVGGLYLIQEPPLTGTGAIGDLTVSVPANSTGKRNAADSAEKFTASSRSSEKIQDVASHGVTPLPATAEPKSPDTVAPIVTATNESTAATASGTPLSIPARPEPVAVKAVETKTPVKAPETPAEPVAAKAVAPKAPVKIPEAPASAPPLRVVDTGRTAMAPAPPPLPAKTAPVDAQAQAKPNPTTVPSVAPPKIETVKPVTIASTSAVGTASGIKTSAPEITPPVKAVPPPAPTRAQTTARAAPEKTRLPEAAPRADAVPPPVPVRTTVASAAPAPVAMATAPAVSRPAFPDLELDRLIGRFIGTYEQGNIDRFMVLFHEDAKTGDKKYNKAATRKEYANLFSTTQMRQMMLQGFRWEKGDDMVRGQGRFTARVAGQSDPQINEYAGNIRIEVANVGGVLLIKGLFHSIESKNRVPRAAESSLTAGK